MDNPKPINEVNSSKMTTRSGRVVKKVAKFNDFITTGKAESLKDKRLAAASEKLHMPQYFIIKHEPELEIVDIPSEMDLLYSKGQRMINKARNTSYIGVYMQEDSTEKKIIKKNEGITKFTAFGLWSKEKRQEILMKHPGLDFGEMSKRLGRMWNKVSKKDKYNWKRKATRLNERTKNLEESKGCQEQLNIIPQQNNCGLKIQNVMTIQKLQIPLKFKEFQLLPIEIARTVRPQKFIVPPRSNLKISAIESLALPRYRQNLHFFRPKELSPIDIAAHMQILGENLLNIGKQMNQYEDKVATSENFDDLLDSLLCGMGSLMCCINYVPELKFQNIPTLTSSNELNSVDRPKNLFRSIRDNIHYIMPGL